MKINLLFDNPGGVRPDYLNIDPLAPQEDSGRRRADIFDLSHSIDANEADEVVALGVLDYVPRSHFEPSLARWVGFLAHGGTLVVDVLDLIEVAHALDNERLTTCEADILLYGPQAKEWDSCKAGHTLEELIGVVEKTGLRVVKKKVENYRAVVVAKRP